MKRYTNTCLTIFLRGLNEPLGNIVRGRHPSSLIDAYKACIDEQNMYYLQTNNRQTVNNRRPQFNPQKSHFTRPNFSNNYVQNRQTQNFKHPNFRPNNYPQNRQSQDFPHPHNCYYRQPYNQFQMNSPQSERYNPGSFQNRTNNRFPQPQDSKPYKPTPMDISGQTRMSNNKPHYNNKPTDQSYFVINNTEIPETAHSLSNQNKNLNIFPQNDHDQFPENRLYQNPYYNSSHFEPESCVTNPNEFTTLDKHLDSTSNFQASGAN